MNVLGQIEEISQKGRKKFIDPLDRDDDRSTLRVVPPAPLMPDLKYTDDELRYLTRNWSAPVVDCVPGFKYWLLGDERKMDRPTNITGHQQRAVDFYWAIRAGMQEGGICLGVGTSNCPGPATLGTDKHYQDFPPPAPENYGTYYTTPMMAMDAEAPFPFFDKQFYGCGANHVIEHMHDPLFTLSEMLRVTREGSPVWLITPDMAFSARGSIDRTHVYEFSSDGFWTWLQQNESKLPPFDVLAFNTLDNEFSFEAVLIRR